MELTESKHFDLELEMMNCVWFRNKVRESKSYAQNLYAAMCNNEFIKNDVWPILEDKRWSCSWRYAGGLVADLREEGDYLDWYCSGIQGVTYDTVEDEKIFRAKQYVGEGIVTDEIRDDLLKLGWIVIEDDNK
jgi:hypothetical protein